MATRIVRKYTCPDADMLDGANVLRALYADDEADFTAYNAVMFPVTWKTDFQTAITAARDVIKDTVVVDEQQETTGYISAKMEEAKQYFQTMKPTIQFSFPNNPARWNQFGGLCPPSTRLSGG